MLKRFAGWLFGSQSTPITPLGIVNWWEARRLAFNIIVGSYGAICLAIFFATILASGKLQPGEDAVEPLALLAAPVAINVLYTLGWLVEVPARILVPSLSPRVGPALLKLGLGFGLLLISMPPAFWFSYLLLQSLGVAR